MNDQGTNAWRIDRLGNVTASRAKDVMSRIKSGEAAARYNYKAELVAEILTKLPIETYTSPSMAWGNLYESEARAVYSAISGIKVIETGFIKHQTLSAGASPDGLVGDDGLIEIKCRNTVNHIETLITRVAPKIYIPQMQMQMWITGRQWCDFVSYDPRLDDKNAIFITRVERDNEYIKELETQVTIFIQEVDQLVERLKK